MEIFDYDNILLLPRKCRVESRADCDTSVEFGPRRFKLPVVPANMKTVLDEPITEWLAAHDYFYVMHRFDLDTVEYAKKMRGKGLFVSVSSGVKEADYRIIDRLAAEGVGADYITIDIAHGHADSVQRMIGHIKQKLPKTFVIAGNVGTPEGVIELGELGRGRDQGRYRPGQGLHHPAEDRLRHRRLAALGAEVVRPRGDQADRRRRRHPPPWRHRQERALRRRDGHGRLAVRRPRGIAGRDGRGRRQALQGSTTARPRTSTRASTSTWKASASWSRSRAGWRTRCARCRRTVQSSISYAGGRTLADLRKVN